MLNQLKNNFLNLRPYSWIDLILLGYLAKFSVNQSLTFSTDDFIFLAPLLLLWFFFNSALEAKHNYSYRGRVSVLLPVFFISLPLIFAFYINSISLVPLLLSVFLVLLYLQKNKNRILGISSTLVRGLIQALYFVFVVLLLESNISPTQIMLLVLVLGIYTARALVGDIRDFKHNTKAGKQTFPVVFGITFSKTAIFGILLLICIGSIFYFNSYLIILPIILFMIAILFFNNGYILHQLMILTTLFFHVNLIAIFTNQELLFLNLIYLGIFLNLIFYPLLERKSNPTFVS